MNKVFSSQHKPLFVAGTVSLIVLGYIFINEYRETSTLYKDSTAKQQLIASSSFIEIADTLDTDGDKLPDWKESLYGTDIQNRDTDADGTIDGEEVNIGRDPNKPGPDDKLRVLQDPNFATSSDTMSDERREFLAKNLAQRGDAIKEDVFKQLMGQFRPNDVRAKYELVDLNISSASDSVALKAYGNAFGKIIDKYVVRNHRNEEEILADAFDKKSSTALKELQYPAISYRNFANDLKLLPVPLPLAKAHLDIVNGYDVMGRGLLQMQLMYTDPINGNGGYQAYTKARLDVTNGYVVLVRYFATNNVAFAKDEAGASFTWPPSALSTAE